MNSAGRLSLLDMGVVLPMSENTQGRFAHTEDNVADVSGDLEKSHILLIRSLNERTTETESCLHVGCLIDCQLDRSLQPIMVRVLGH